MDVDRDAAPADSEAPAKKRRVKKIDVPFTSLATSLDPAVLEKFKEQEAQMHAADKLVQDTKVRTYTHVTCIPVNTSTGPQTIAELWTTLNEYMSVATSSDEKFNDRYAPYVQPPEKTKLLAMLQEVEDWLYSEEGEDATKSACVTKLDTLKTLGAPSSGVSRSRRVLQRDRRAPDDA
ncbi:hypothetical protein BU15DRAFT_78264 [Melanogaster broomeanus]|nr:hypothetical protein BU15DRAFT_78264 [Melanogaster broomeanus]